MLLRRTGACVLAALGPQLDAQSIAVPASYENVRGNGGANTITRDAGNPRTYMLGFPAAELSGIPVGATIVGVSFRAQVSTGNPASWPPSNAVWASYEVTLGASVPLASWTTTFASNFAGTPVKVRAGSLTIEAGTYPNVSSLPTPAPNAWGDFFWDFQMPFTYTGGDLAVLLSHTGSNLVGSFLLTDWQSTLSTIKGMTASSFQATTGTMIASPAITRIHFGYGAGCQGSGGMAPMLVLSNGTSGGGTTGFALGNAPAGALAAVALGVGRTSLPLPGGCVLLTLPLVTLPTTLSATGRAKLVLNVPPGVVGSVDAQGFVADPGAPAGFTATNGVTLQAR